MGKPEEKHAVVLWSSFSHRAFTPRCPGIPQLSDDSQKADEKP
jgi:hypothetical protein